MRVARIGTASTFLVALLTAGCVAPVGTGGAVSVPKDSASQCAVHCQSIGLALDSVVIMASNVGCVCRVGASAAASADGAHSAGGMAALVVAQQQQQQQQQSYHPH